MVCEPAQRSANSNLFLDTYGSFLYMTMKLSRQGRHVCCNVLRVPVLPTWSMMIDSSFMVPSLLFSIDNTRLTYQATSALETWSFQRDTWPHPARCGHMNSHSSIAKPHQTPLAGRLFFMSTPRHSSFMHFYNPCLIQFSPALSLLVPQGKGKFATTPGADSGNSIV